MVTESWHNSFNTESNTFQQLLKINHHGVWGKHN